MKVAAQDPLNSASVGGTIAISKSIKGQRKGKKEWRKHIDISPIEDQLAEFAKEEMAGGKKLLDTSDASLFVVDKRGDAGATPIKPLKKRLRIEELLDVRSKTKALAQSRGSTHFSAAEVMKLPRMATKLNAETKRSVEKTNKETLLSDPWKMTSTSFKPPRLQAPVISRTIRAAEICHPGTSYNPTAKDHSDAIQIATKIELVKLKRIESDLLAGNKRVLMSTQGLDADMSMEVADDQSEDDVELSLVSDEATLKNLRKIKKTRLQRNKAARHKLLLAAASAQRERRKYLAQLDEVDEVARVLDEKLSKRKLELEMRKRQLAVRETTVTARLSRHPFIAPPMAIQLTEELSESLRALQPEGNLMLERFKNLQKRNIIECRMIKTSRPRNRYPVKLKEKRSYKRFDQLK